MQSWVYEHSFATLDLSLEQLGAHLVICISGGDAPHIGSVVLSTPRPSLTGAGTSATSSVLNLPGHKDEAVARQVSEALAATLDTTVCCICGIHVDDATPEAVASCATLGQELADFLIANLSEDDLLSQTNHGPASTRE